MPELSSSASKKRKLAAPATPRLPQLAPETGESSSSTPSTTQPEEEPAEQQEFDIGEDDSPEISIKRHEELKHGPNQCFCGKGDLKTEEERDQHFKVAHYQKGRGLNPKTNKKKDLWACSSCNPVCRDNRSV